MKSNSAHHSFTALKNKFAVLVLFFSKCGTHSEILYFSFCLPAVLKIKISHSKHDDQLLKYDAFYSLNYSAVYHAVKTGFNCASYIKIQLHSNFTSTILLIICTNVLILE